MKNRLIEAIASWPAEVMQAAMFASIGMFIGMGQLLASQEKLTIRIVIGRSLSSGGLAMAAGLVLVWVPDLPMVGQYGVAAALASLGTSGLERVFQRLLQGRG